MRIGIDAREICGQSTGVGRWLGMLLRQWAAQSDSPHEFVLYAPETPGLSITSSRMAWKIVAGGRGTAWEQMRLPREATADRLDVFFAPAYTAPLQLDVPVVALIHDVSFDAHPEWYTRREGLRRRLLTRRTGQAACAVITVSEFSRREIVDRLGVPEDRVRVVLPGIDPPRLVAASTPREPRVLYVGSIFNRRRVPGLINAFAHVAHRHPQTRLDIVGDNRTYPLQDIRNTIVRAEVERQVRWHEYISDDDLAVLYASARAFAFLSEYEGLGLTPLEALAAGVPPLLLDTPVARESCGEAALYVDQDDARGVTAGLERLLFDEKTRDAILSRAPETLARYTWSRAAREVMAALEACGSR